MSGEQHRQQRRAVTVVPVQIVGDLFHANGYSVNLSTSGSASAGAQVPEKGQHVFLWLQPPKPYTSITIEPGDGRNSLNTRDSQNRYRPIFTAQS